MYLLLITHSHHISSSHRTLSPCTFSLPYTVTIYLSSPHTVTIYLILTTLTHHVHSCHQTHTPCAFFSQQSHTMYLLLTTLTHHVPSSHHTHTLYTFFSPHSHTMYLLLTTRTHHISPPYPQGISYNNLSGRVFCGILSCLQRNSSLGSLDVSHNSLKHSAHVKESLRQFLRHNKGIRTLDLSHNKFTAETTNVIHLGLLENDGTYVHLTIMITLHFILSKQALLNKFYCDSTICDDVSCLCSHILPLIF